MNYPFRRMRAISYSHHKQTRFHIRPPNDVESRNRLSGDLFFQSPEAVA